MTDTLPRVHALISRGEIEEALSLLEVEAAKQADAVLWAELATLQMSGIAGSPNFSAARQSLRSAVQIGHVDAALTEIALTGNGTGDSRDWSQACQLLHTAARNDPVAAHQLDLLRAMAIDELGSPLSKLPVQQLCDTPLVQYFPAFLSRAECEHIATVGGGMLEPSMVLDPRSGSRIANPIRICDEAAIGPSREDLVVQAINYRIAHASASDVTCGEPLTVLRYHTGGQYRSHLDVIDRTSNQRVSTMLLYLNEGFSGGETFFPELDLRITPRAGDGLLFNNVLPDGRADPRSRHAGLPVLRGSKWLATRWIRANTYDPWARN